MSIFSARGNKIHFISLGCPRNFVDTEHMLGLCLKEGFDITHELKKADYVVINTCGFLQSARDESCETIASCINEKKKGARVIAAGCMVSKHKEELKERCPEIDYMIGPGDVGAIIDAIKSTEIGEKISKTKSFLDAGEVPRFLATPRNYAYLKIAEGCAKACAYCIIPQIKGRLRSKSVAQVVKEFHLLLDQGVQEIILIAQDLGDFGKDAGYKKSDGLTLLLKTLLDIPGQYWIRLLYLYPDELTPELLAVMASDERICPYIDMPIQHIDDAILKAMKRHTTAKDIVTTLNTLRQAIPQIAIRTSLIVGFPGETEEQFEKLLSFIQEQPIEHLGVFEYSREKGSAADLLSAHIEDSIKKERRARLMQAQEKLLPTILSKYVGQTLECVVESYHPDSKLLLAARHRGQCPDIDGMVIVNDVSAVDAFGQRIMVDITGQAGCDLVGTPQKSRDKKQSRTGPKAKKLPLLV